MSDAITGRRRVPSPENDPNLTYAPGTPERAELKARLASMASETVDIPIIIGGKEIRSGATEKSVMPHKLAMCWGTSTRRPPITFGRPWTPRSWPVRNGRAGRLRIAPPCFSVRPNC